MTIRIGRQQKYNYPVLGVGCALAAWACQASRQKYYPLGSTYQLVTMLRQGIPVSKFLGVHSCVSHGKSAQKDGRRESV
jgi:hypothetical protein